LGDVVIAGGGAAAAAWDPISVIAMAAINSALTAVFSDDVGSGILDAPLADIALESSTFLSPGDVSDESEGMDATVLASADMTRRGFSAAGEACFKNACGDEKQMLQ
jgi:hypothetical protein